VASPGDNLLEVENLRVSFATESGVAKVLDGVNLTIRPGEIMGLVGESGCGKTTLANAILGILAKNARHEAGTIRFGGEDLLAMPRRRIEDEVRGRRITFIPQDPYGSFNPLFPIGTQAMEVMKWKSPQRAAGESRGVAGFFSRYPRARRRADAAAVSQMLRAVQIPDRDAAFVKLPHEFSGGQRQRLMIALALLPQPQLVIADEPTTALDVTIQAQILDLLQDMKERFGMAVMLITHAMGVVAETAQRVVVMYAGKVVEEADVDSLFESPRHPYTQGLIRSIPRIDLDSAHKTRLETIGGTVPILIDPAPGCRFAPRCRFAFALCSEQEPVLREVTPGHRMACHLGETQGMSA
jgi:peptide/nickel transport system ATP-binding protein